MKLMDSLRRALYRIATFGRHDAMSAALDEELSHHADLLAQDFERQGMTRSDAARAARRKLGNPLSIRERTADRWGIPLLDHFRQDLHFGFRLVRRSPMLSCVAIGAIAIAVGVNAGFFTLVDAFVWQPLPVAHPERLVRLFTIDRRNITDLRFSYPEMQALTAAHSVSDVSAYYAQPAAVRFNSSADAVSGSVGIVSSNYFISLGAQRLAGRLLAAGDGADEAPVAVLSDGAWSKWFARSPDVAGRDIFVNGAHVTIAGVAAADFVGLNPLVPDMWMTVPQADRVGILPGRIDDVSNRFLVLHARLDRRSTMASARQELSSLLRGIERPATAADSLRQVVGTGLTPRSSLLSNDLQTATLLLPAIVVVLLVLVIACANLANLLLARALARQREVGVRLALGASRGRLIAQLLTESGILALTGCILGYLIARVVVSVAGREFFSNIPTTLGAVALSLRPSWRIVVLTAGLGALSVLTFGLAPALQATTPSLTAALKGDDQALGMRFRRSRVRDVLISVQVAASLVLLSAAAIIANGVRSFAATATGLSPAPVLIATLGITAPGHATGDAARARAEFAARVERLPSAASVARAMNPPFSPWGYLRVAPAGGDTLALFVQTNRVSPRYFDVVGQRVLDGRAFLSSDTSSLAPVVIVSRTAGRALWPRQSPIGQRIRMQGRSDVRERIATVVGEVSDSHSGMLWDDDANGAVFEPVRSAALDSLDYPLLVKSSGSVAATASDLDGAARLIDRNMPLTITPLPQLRDAQIMPFRYGAIVTSSIGLAGLALAVIGLYGVVSFAVRQRERDTAIRRAIGASTLDVVRAVLRRELRLILAGLALGLVLSAGESALISTLSLPVPSLGILGTAGIALLLFVVAAIAIAFPTRDALRVSPMQALRQE